jgi:uncharacterized protein YegL
MSSEQALQVEVINPVFNPGQKHLACVLLLDKSVSMSGNSIKSLNAGIRRFLEQTSKDEIAQQVVDIAIVTFDDIAHKIQAFTPLSAVEPPDEIQAEGTTNMADAIVTAITMIRERERQYDSLICPKFPSWIFMITDGEPNGGINSLAEAKRQIDELEHYYSESNQQVVSRLKFWAVGVDDYNKQCLLHLTNRVIELTSHDFTNTFDWLSESMVIISASQVGDIPRLPTLENTNMRILDPNTVY